MGYRVIYLEEKYFLINKWICQLTKQYELYRETADTVSGTFQVTLPDFGKNLEGLKNLFYDVSHFNDRREQFNIFIANAWNRLEQSFKRSASEYERLCNTEITNNLV